MRRTLYIFLAAGVFFSTGGESASCSLDDPGNSGSEDAPFAADADELDELGDASINTWLDAGPCEPLLDKYCGLNRTDCASSPSCVAVTLMSQSSDATGRCTQLAENPGEFEECVDVRLCLALVQKVCGSGDPAPCGQRPSCLQARQLLADTTNRDGGSLSTVEFCAEALQESSAFPACDLP